MNDRSAQRREHSQNKGRLFSLKPRLLRCEGPSQAGRVDLVHLVCLVYPVSLVQLNKRERRDKPERPARPDNDMATSCGEVRIMPQDMVASPIEPKRVLHLMPYKLNKSYPLLLHSSAFALCEWVLSLDAQRNRP